MSKRVYKYIYGPVPSWRLGSSLGIDSLSQDKKICTFDCIYCQIGKTNHLTDKRDVFAKVGDIVEEIDSLPPLEIDYMTFSGTGEPTLAKNLGQMIKALKKIRNEKIAVLTNSSLMYRKDVQEDLFAADLIVAKLDASSQNIFELVNQPIKTVKLDSIIQAIKDFKNCYLGRLALQIMFMAENKKHAKEIAQIAREIKPDEVQLNTPLRPCKIRPLSEDELDAIGSYFSGLNIVSVYKAERKKIKPISSKDTLKRRGKI
ncbi:MAG TPA: radical SAM protein [Candidatus Atribacteria bacterium]|nr:radical SAM protein [Candidatus Atribacteria bacterium]